MEDVKAVIHGKKSLYLPPDPETSPFPSLKQPPADTRAEIDRLPVINKFGCIALGDVKQVPIGVDAIFSIFAISVTHDFHVFAPSREGKRPTVPGWMIN